ERAALAYARPDNDERIRASHDQLVPQIVAERSELLSRVNDFHAGGSAQELVESGSVARRPISSKARGCYRQDEMRGDAGVHGGLRRPLINTSLAAGYEFDAGRRFR